MIWWTDCIMLINLVVNDRRKSFVIPGTVRLAAITHKARCELRERNETKPKVIRIWWNSFEFLFVELSREMGEKQTSDGRREHKDETQWISREIFKESTQEESCWPMWCHAKASNAATSMNRWPCAKSFRKEILSPKTTESGACDIEMCSTNMWRAMQSYRRLSSPSDRTLNERRQEETGKDRSEYLF